MDRVLIWLQYLNSWIWGLPLIILLVGTGFYLTLILKGLQFRYLPYALKLALVYKDHKSQGDVSHFQSLMMALAATIGIGNIVGVATAVSIGGLGAIFWMWVTALVGMATKYGEAILAVKYRCVDSNGEMCGGPMYYIEKGMGLKFLAVAFAVFAAFAAFGIGNMVQAHSVGDALEELFGFAPWKTGLTLAVLTGLVLLGGVRAIGRVASVLVPFMAISYISMGIVILWIHLYEVPAAFISIFEAAFSGQAAAGGFLGSTMMLAMRMGISRGVFSNEAGLGSAPIVAAAARTDSPGRQAMVSMTGTFLDTIVVCTITGLVIAVTGVIGDYDEAGAVLNGAPMTVMAFESAIPGGGYFVTFALMMFAYSTILGWAYYGEKSFEYLFGERYIYFYRVLFTLAIIPGASISLSVVWSFADLANGLMAIPNLIALLVLSRHIREETQTFLASIK